MGFNHSDNIVNFLLNEESTKRIPALFHISFKDNLEGEWKPRPPDGFQIKAKEKNKEKEVNITEPKTPRISCSTDLKKCFYAIYPNISFFFETKKFPYMDFTVYSPRLNGEEKIWTPEYLTDKKLVHDAHVTNEYCILEKVFMQKVGHLRVFNPLKKSNNPPEIYYHPFNNESYERKFLAYKVEIKYDPIKEK